MLVYPKKDPKYSVSI